MLSQETDYVGSNVRDSSIVLSLVSSAGTGVKTIRFTVPLILPTATSAVLRSSGDIVFGVSGRPYAGPEEKSPIWTNPKTGTKKFSCTYESSYIFSIDPKTLDIRKQAFFPENGKITRLKQFGDRTYGTFLFSHDCRIETNVRLVEVSEELELTTLFESANVNSIRVSDFAISSDGFVLVGVASTFLPVALVNKTMTLEELKNYKGPDLLDDSVWDKYDQTSNALILVLSRDGKLQGDKILYDVRNRAFSSLADLGFGHFMAVGSALGNNGWIVKFEMKAQSKRPAAFERVH